MIRLTRVRVVVRSTKSKTLTIICTSPLPKNSNLPHMLRIVVIILVGVYPSEDLN
jgi:hypothetical protein